MSALAGLALTRRLAVRPQLIPNPLDSGEIPTPDANAMALFTPGFTPCAICGVVLNKEDDRVATSHFITDLNHPLFRFSDACMHRTCFLTWDQREAFVGRYNDSAERHNWRVRMEPDGTILKRNPT